MVSRISKWSRHFYKAEHLPPSKNWGYLLTPILITFLMLVVEYFGWQMPFMNWISKDLGLEFANRHERFFYAQMWTTASFFLWLVFVPLFFHWCFPLEGAARLRLDLRSIGLGLKGVSEHWVPYAFLIGLMMPILWMATSQPHFYEFYPIYRPSSLGDWLTYEAIYLLQFIGIEFFFRGWGLFRMEKIIPGWGVIFMVLPYALIHIHKPFPEAVASIVAGLVLGYLALKSRSIWPGVLVHACIAFCTDFFSLIHAGIFMRWWG